VDRQIEPCLRTVSANTVADFVVTANRSTKMRKLKLRRAVCTVVASPEMAYFNPRHDDDRVAGPRADVFMKSSEGHPNTRAFLPLICTGRCSLVSWFVSLEDARVDAGRSICSSSGSFGTCADSGKTFRACTETVSTVRRLLTACDVCGPAAARCPPSSM
jgi:hypothetical protein